VEYGTLNDITEKDCFPLPRIDDTLDTLSGAMWFSTFDVKSGYWQWHCIPMIRRRRSFPQVFGLCKAPSTF
jgi:hypothetical protein